MSRRTVVAGAVDLAVVLAFAAVGRRSHVEGLSVPGVLTTAWPFLTGLALGWLLARGWRRPAALRTGAVVWPATVVVAMVLRRVVDAGTAPPFVVVATLVLGTALLGWRALWMLGRRA